MLWGFASHLNVYGLSASEMLGIAAEQAALRLKPYMHLQGYGAYMALLGMSGWDTIKVQA